MMNNINNAFLNEAKTNSLSQVLIYLLTKQFIIFIAQKMRRFLPKYIMQVIIFFCILFQI